MSDDIACLCIDFRALAPVVQVELADGVAQLLGLEVGGDCDLVGRVAVVFAAQRVLRKRSVRDSVLSGCLLI